MFTQKGNPFPIRGKRGSEAKRLNVNSPLSVSLSGSLIPKVFHFSNSHNDFKYSTRFLFSSAVKWSMK